MSTQKHACMCSELSIPWGGEFSIFSPSRTGNLTRCGYSCMLVTPARILSRKLTSIAMDGEGHLMPWLTARLTLDSLAAYYSHAHSPWREATSANTHASGLPHVCCVLLASPQQAASQILSSE